MLVEQARTHYDAREWVEAVTAFERAQQASALSLDDAERFAWARLWTLAPVAECLDAFEKLEADALQGNDTRLAARAALEQARMHSMLGSDAMAVICWRRGVDHVADPDAPEAGFGHALFAVAMSVAGDHAAARTAAQAALDAVARSDDPTAEAVATWVLGTAAVMAGELDSGIELLDKAMSMAVTGAVHPLYSGMVSCGVVMTCRTMGDWQRAREWNEAADRYCARESVCHFPGHCSVFRSELTRARGDFEAAAQEASLAIALAGDWSQAWVGMAHHQRGEAELCRGDLDAAQESFNAATEAGYEPQPGLARLLAAKGNVTTGFRLIGRALERTDGYSLATSMHVLSAGVTIAISHGALDQAGEWRDELSALAARFTTPVLGALAAQAEGEVCVAEGRADAAADALYRAVATWSALDAPFDTAKARALLAGALDETGDHAGAALEREIAAGVFERLGARLELEALQPDDAVELAHERHTFSFTDIVGSSELLSAMGDVAWGQVLTTHDRLMRDLLVDFGGTEVKHEGDGFFVAFPSEVAAVGWAVAVQQRLKRHRADHGFAPTVRVGVHCGEAMRYGDDFIGRCVHETARIANAANGDQILVSAGTAQALGERFAVAGELELELKGFSEPQPVVEIDWDR